MDNVYTMAWRLSKHLSNICIILVLGCLIFVYLITLNGKGTKDVVYDDDLSSINNKNVLRTLEERSYEVNEGNSEWYIYNKIHENDSFVHDTSEPL